MTEGQKCPECGSELECMVTLGADQTLSGKEERLFLCRKCLSTWEVTTNDDGTTNIKRYFFG